MRVFAGGASGVVGARLVPQTHRARAQGDRDLQVTQERRAGQGALGAEPVTLGQQPARVRRRIAGGS